MKVKAKSVVVLIMTLLLLLAPVCNLNVYAKTSNRQKILIDAKKKKGWGYYRIGKCTGFVCHTMRHSKAKLKVKVPKNGTVSTLKRKWRKCKVKSPKKGDVVAYGNQHVAIYIGNGKIIHASSSRGIVMVASMYIMGNRTYYSLVQ